MAIVLLNGDVTGISYPARTWAELLAVLDEQCASTGDVVAGVRIGDADVPAFRTPENLSRVLDADAPVLIETARPADLILQTLDEAEAATRSIVDAALALGGSYRAAGRIGGQPLSARIRRKSRHLDHRHGHVGAGRRCGSGRNRRRRRVGPADDRRPDWTHECASRGATRRQLDAGRRCHPVRHRERRPALAASTGGHSPLGSVAARRGVDDARPGTLVAVAARPGRRSDLWRVARDRALDGARIRGARGRDAAARFRPVRCRVAFAVGAVDGGRAQDPAACGVRQGARGGGRRVGAGVPSRSGHRAGSGPIERVGVRAAANGRQQGRVLVRRKPPGTPVLEAGGEGL